MPYQPPPRERCFETRRTQSIPCGHGAGSKPFPGGSDAAEPAPRATRVPWVSMLHTVSKHLSSIGGLTLILA